MLCDVMIRYSVARGRARGEVVHTSGITMLSPGGAGCAPVMPQVGHTSGRLCGRDNPQVGAASERFQAVSSPRRELPLPAPSREVCEHQLAPAAHLYVLMDVVDEPMPPSSAELDEEDAIEKEQAEQTRVGYAMSQPRHVIVPTRVRDTPTSGQPALCDAPGGAHLGPAIWP